MVVEGLTFHLQYIYTYTQPTYTHIHTDVFWSYSPSTPSQSQPHTHPFVLYSYWVQFALPIHAGMQGPPLRLGWATRDQATKKELFHLWQIDQLHRISTRKFKIWRTWWIGHGNKLFWSSKANNSRVKWLKGLKWTQNPGRDHMPGHKTRHSQSETVRLRPQFNNSAQHSAFQFYSY